MRKVFLSGAAAKDDCEPPERIHLIQGALSRASERGIPIKNNKFIWETPYGYKSGVGTREEAHNAEAAIEEERTAGHTERRCLRDGGLGISWVSRGRTGHSPL